MTRNDPSRIVLGIETCTQICSVALWDGEQMHEKVLETPQSHSKQLLPMIDDVLKTSELSMRDIDAIACSRGPGSFTGVRIGVGVAKGLAYGQSISILPVSPLQAVAYQVIQSEPNVQVITALLDARMGELYAGRYQLSETGLPVLLDQEMLTTLENLELSNSCVGGTAILEYHDALMEQQANCSSVVYPLASAVVRLALLSEITPLSAADFQPVYLRNKVTD